MPAPQSDAFFDQFPHMGLSYDDVLLATQYADFLPAETSLATRFSRNVGLNVPFASAAMDTVTQARMAIGMALGGGIGVIHKNLEPEEQRTLVKRVKYYLNGFVSKARTMPPDMTVGELYRIKAEKRWGFSTFPIVDENDRPIGMVTRRELKYCDSQEARLGDIMVKDLLTAPRGTTIHEAHAVMRENKISILPLVDADGAFIGMYSYKDVADILKNQNPFYNRDDKHRLRCAAAVGPAAEERVECLMEAELDVLVVDTAHGHTKGVLDMVRWIKAHHPEVDVVGGNVATAEGAKALAEAGADAVKVGVGPGSICTTRVVAGVGMPQLSAVHECARALRGTGVALIADGGVRHSGDVAKALAAGADCVMMGGVLAGTDESPGERVLYRGRQYIVYRGMGSIEAMKQRFGSADRYGQQDVAPEKLVPEGVEGMVPYAGPLSDLLNLYVGGLRQSLGYNGARTIEALRENARFVRVTAAGVRESHPHDITMTKDAPNYKSNEKA